MTRWGFVREWVENKKVLDIGPAELTGTENPHKLENSMHLKIRSVASSISGLEKSRVQVEALTKLGYQMEQGDAEDFNLDQKFEVVFAGELIEHLSNPGTFLDNVRQHLLDDGVLILTTPNRFDAVTFASYFRRNLILSYNKPIAKHVAYYDENCLSDLLVRHGFDLCEIGYYEWVGMPRREWKTQLFINFLKKYRIQYLPGLMVVAGKKSRGL